MVHQVRLQSSPSEMVQALHFIGPWKELWPECHRSPAEATSSSGSRIRTDLELLQEEQHCRPFAEPWRDRKPSSPSLQPPHPYSRVSPFLEQRNPAIDAF